MNFGFPYPLLSRFQPLYSGAMISTPAFNSPAVWCREFHSRVFHSFIFDALAFSTPAFSVAPMRCWHGCLSGVRCKWFIYSPADATATPSPLASLTSRMVFSFWCRLTTTVLEKRPENRCYVFPLICNCLDYCQSFLCNFWNVFVFVLILTSSESECQGCRMPFLIGGISRWITKWWVASGEFHWLASEFLQCWHCWSSFSVNTVKTKNLFHLSTKVLR